MGCPWSILQRNLSGAPNHWGVRALRAVPMRGSYAPAAATCAVASACVCSGVCFRAQRPALGPLSKSISLVRLCFEVLRMSMPASASYSQAGPGLNMQRVGLHKGAVVAVPLSRMPRLRHVVSAPCRVNARSSIWGARGAPAEAVPRGHDPDPAQRVPRGQGGRRRGRAGGRAGGAAGQARPE